MSEALIALFFVMTLLFVLLVFVALRPRAQVVPEDDNRLLAARLPTPPLAPTRMQAKAAPATRAAPVQTSRGVQSSPTRPPPNQSASPWVPPGTAVTVAGYVLRDGMLYVGEPIRAVGREGVEPALINPKLGVNRSNPARAGEGMSYWPSYSEIGPRNRAAYLEWLAAGRRSPDAYIGYVFLFFYGLERRVLIDSADDPRVANELPEIVRELEDLLKVYGHNGSFASYGGGFLELCRWKADPTAEVRDESPLFGWEVPFTLRVAIARCASEGRPLPADLAFAWVMNGPETNRRTPAMRCTSELRQLFRLRYARAFGEGRELRKGRSWLKLEYRPATASIGTGVEATVKGLKDATREGPPAEVKNLLEQCVEDLDPYSRWLGRRKADQPLLPGLMLLPADLLGAHDARELADLRSWLTTFPTADGPVVIDAAELFARWPDAADGKVTKAESTALAVFLEKLGFGIEPDVRFLGTPPTQTGSVVLFRNSEGAHSTVSREYAAASTLLHFASAVAAADGVDPSETRFLTDHVGNVVGLADGERARLAAHLLWLLREPRAASQLKKLAVSIPDARREELAQFLVCVAGADGTVTKKEIALLGRIYASFGLDDKMVYSHLHGLGSDSSVVGEPVTVKPAEPLPSSNFAIPKRPEAGSAPSPGPKFQLDMARVQARLNESAAISAVLADIFRDQEEAPPAPIAVITADPVASLDGPHSSLVRRLAEAPTWTRADWNLLCASFGLLPDGAIDTVNEAALDACGEALLSGDDPIDVDSNVLGELIP